MNDAEKRETAYRIIDYVNDVVDTSRAVPQVKTLLDTAYRLLNEVDPGEANRLFSATRMLDELFGE
jgi:hypothetical protein